MDPHELEDLIERWDRQAESDRFRGHVVHAMLDKAKLLDGRPLRGAEVGVFCGTLSRFLLGNLPQLTLYMVDRWQPAEDASYAESGDMLAALTYPQWQRIKEHADEATEFADDRRHILHGKSTGCWNIDAPLDFVFIDAGHDYESVLRDIRLWGGRVHADGLVMGHDWGSPVATFEVERAVKEYARETGGVIWLGPDQCWGVKRS